MVRHRSAQGYAPAEIIERLNREINAALADPSSRRALPISAAPCLRARPPISES